MRPPSVANIARMERMEHGYREEISALRIRPTAEGEVSFQTGKAGPQHDLRPAPCWPL